MKVSDFNSLQDFLRTHDVFNRFGIKRIGVFGSFARNEKFNDIDLLVEDKMDYKSRFALKSFLEKELEISIDLVQKDLAEPIILHRAMKDIRYATIN